MSRQTTKEEGDIRVDLFNSLLSVPHRDLEKISKAHKDVIEKDPRFYVKLAAWYFDKGEIRDHKEMFIATLSTSLKSLKLKDDEGKEIVIGVGNEELRNVGLALLRKLPPYEVCRVLDFVKGATNPPRSFKTEIKRYLKERENDDEKFDNAVLFARKCIKGLYASLRIKPSLRADKILFKNDPPKDSKLFVLKSIAKMQDPTKQAKALMESKIPYRVASTIIKKLTPPIMIALIDSMSDQELINNISALKKHGSFNNPEVRKLVSEKLQKAKRGKRVSAYKAKKAVEVSGVKGKIKEDLEEVTETQIKAKGEIKRATALFCDCSGSMERAIEVATRVGSMISAICKEDLFVYAFDIMAHKIKVKGDKLKDWEKAFEDVTAFGGTSCGVAIDSLRKNKEYVEQIIYITDENENNHPWFSDSLTKYKKELKVTPNILFIKVGDHSNLLEEECKKTKTEFDAYIFKEDYYALPSIIPFISKASRLDLIDEIMNYPVPSRLLA